MALKLSFFKYAMPLCAAFLCFSCAKTINSEEQYFKYLNDKKNGLVYEKSVNGFKLIMKYISPEFLAYKEIGTKEGQSSHSDKDSLIASYQKGVTVLFSIAEEQEEIKHDITQYNVFSEEEFKRRFHELHFNINEHIWINHEAGKVKPGLSMLESTFELGGPRKFYLVFDAQNEWGALNKLEKLDIVFNDVFFDTGISHFIFKQQDINNIPKLSFWK